MEDHSFPVSLLFKGIKKNKEISKKEEKRLSGIQGIGKIQTTIKRKPANWNWPWTDTEKTMKNVDTIIFLMFWKWSRDMQNTKKIQIKLSEMKTTIWD